MRRNIWTSSSRTASTALRGSQTKLKQTGRLKDHDQTQTAAKSAQKQLADFVGLQRTDARTYGFTGHAWCFLKKALSRIPLILLAYKEPSVKSESTEIFLLYKTT